MQPCAAELSYLLWLGSLISDQMDALSQPDSVSLSCKGKKTSSSMQILV